MKTKFGRKDIKDDESSCRPTKEMDFENYSDRHISYFFEILYHFSNLIRFLQVKRDGGKPSKGRLRTFFNRGKT